MEFDLEMGLARPTRGRLDKLASKVSSLLQGPQAAVLWQSALGVLNSVYIMEMMAVDFALTQLDHIRSKM